MCNAHHHKWLKYGDPLAGRTQIHLPHSASTEDRFWIRVDKNGPVPELRPELGPCWIWRGSVTPSTGYGAFWWKNRLSTSHRFAYEREGATVPDGLNIDHLCRNRRCVNSSHLEAVTTQVNLLRGVGMSAQHAAQTHCFRGHPFDLLNTRFDNKGRRHCRACKALGRTA